MWSSSPAKHFQEVSQIFKELSEEISVECGRRALSQKNTNALQSTKPLQLQPASHLKDELTTPPINC
jgi:hypothetical protein